MSSTRPTSRRGAGDDDASASLAPTLDGWFAARSALQPDAPALTVGERTLSYAELHRLASYVAARLVAAGTRPGDVVPVCVDQTRAVQAVLGVLMTGAAYLPLDPRQPQERLHRLLQQACGGVVLADEGTVDRLPDSAGAHVLLPNDRLALLEGVQESARTLDGAPDQLAYVMFTSGSTGAPKAVQITHGNVTRLMSTTAAVYPPVAGDVWTMCHSYAFDFSVWEMWGALLHGGRLVVVDPQDVRSPDALLTLLEREGVTVLSQTPAAMLGLARADEQRPAALDRLRLVVLGGERLDPATLSTWFTRHADDAPQIVNMYGITETTVHVTHRRIKREDAMADEGTSPIGTALPDLSVVLLDDDGGPVGVGEDGEICVSGPGLSPGYRDDPETTDRRFRSVTWGPGDVRRTYFSGDLARLTSEGELLYRGRKDEQVKVRGHRVELGEVAAALRLHLDVVDAVVDTDTGLAVGQGLRAWVVSRDSTGDASWLREHAAAHLPGYMVPSLVQVVDRIPLTANGKADRTALRASDERVTAVSGPLARQPQDLVGQVVESVWAQELGVAAPEPDDDFFLAGGHSLLVVKVVTRLRAELGIHLGMSALFDAPRFADFLSEVRTAVEGAAADAR
jgi:amino acid adenylation domain-containing protein